MDFHFDFYGIGRFVGILIMMISFIILIYFLVIQASNIFLWEIAAAFWFGSSVYWESSYYEKIVK